MILKKTTTFRDNRGMTLVELIIVMTIIIVISVGSLLGFGVLGYGGVKEAAGRMKSLADYVRLENMTRSEQYYLVIYHEDDNYYACVQARGNDGSSIDIRKEKLDLKKGHLYYQDSDDNRYLISSYTVEDIEVKDRLEITFTKDTGGLRKDPAVKNVKFIEMAYSKGSYKIYFVEATGKTYIE